MKIEGQECDSLGDKQVVEVRKTMTSASAVLGLEYIPNMQIEVLSKLLVTATQDKIEELS